MYSGRLLSKRNYIDRKLKEIENELLERGWIEEGWDDEIEETNEEDEPIESAGALIPYINKVNKKLDFFESVVEDNIRGQQTPYYNNKPVRQQQNNLQQTQQELKRNLNDQLSNMFI